MNESRAAVGNGPAEPDAAGPARRPGLETGPDRAREIALGAAVPLLLITVILAADVVEGPKTAYVGVLTFVPMLAAVFARPRITAAVGITTWLAAFAFGRVAEDGNVTAQQVRLVIIALSVVIATVASVLRLRGDRELAAARIAAAEAQAMRRREGEAHVHQQELERQRRIRSELLRELDDRLDTDQRGADPLRALVDLLVPRFADAAVIEAVTAGPGDGEARVGERLAERGAEAATGDAAVELVAAFDGGRAGSLRLRLRRSDPARGSFSETEQSYLDQLTARAGVALARRDVRTRQREIASELQRALLPTTLAEVPGIDVAATYVAAGEMLDVGGDWYDSIELPDGRLLLAVGDVVGHGLAAAAVMGQLRSGLAALGTRITDPADLLVALDAFADGPDRDRYATVACAVLDPRTGMLEYASAGHPPLLAIAPDGTVTWLEDATSVPLASVRPPSRPASRQLLAPGTTLVLYTDGLIEARRTGIDAGLAQLAAAAVAARHEPLDELSRHLVDGLVAPGGFTDDVVVLAARLSGLAAG